MKSDRVYEAFCKIIETLSNDKGRVMCKKELDILGQALQRLDSIDNVNSNDAIKCLTGLEKEIIQRDGRITDFLKIKFDIIKQALIKAQEQEKVLNIMKDKWVNVAVLIHSKAVEEYNNTAHTPYNLAQEEFELLKRYFAS